MCLVWVCAYRCNHGERFFIAMHLAPWRVIKITILGICHSFAHLLNKLPESKSKSLTKQSQRKSGQRCDLFTRLAARRERLWDFSAYSLFLWPHLGSKVLFQLQVNGVGFVSTPLLISQDHKLYNTPRNQSVTADTIFLHPMHHYL